LRKISNEMTQRHLFKTAVGGLKAHKSRSALTILGIVIGITAIILVVSLGEGAQKLILSEVESIGPRIIAVVPGRQPKGPTDIFSTFTDSLKNSDLDSLRKKSNVPYLEFAMPVVFGSASASFENETYRPTIFGVDEHFAEIYNLYPEKGGFLFTADDVRSYTDVVLIGSKVRDELFGTSDAVGQKIRIKNRNFRVAGVFPKKGQSAFLNFDDAAVMPYTTAQRNIFAIKYFNRLVVQADKEENVAQTVEDVKRTLRVSHNITDPDKDDFFVETQEDALETVGTVTSVLTMFLASIAAISLIVGGVGIMNIMLVSVTERTREIGLRKAVGATYKNVLAQFLLEAVILTAIGGVLGIIMGSLFSFLISIILSKVVNLSWSFVFPTGAALLGLGVASLVGLIFGIYPARQAAQKSPIEALRYE